MFNKIKKQNGERFAKAIRAYDNGIFDVENLDKIIKYAGRQAEPIMNYLISLKDIKIEEHGVYKDPIALLNEAGYDAFYVETLEQQNSIIKYYAPGEALCTFRDPNRFKDFHMIHCVRKDVDKIERGDPPQREDEYGTSVISIQILKTGGFISIKNRYNHTVENPDNTLNSNPDKIIPGLAEAIKHAYNVDFTAQKVELPKGYVEMNDQLIKYHMEVNNHYFGDTFYAKNGEVFEVNKSDELVLDNFVLNWKTNEVKNPAGHEDAFVQALAQEIEGKNLQVVKNEDGSKSLMADGYKILEIKDGQIVKLDFQNVTEIGDNFLTYNTMLNEINLPKVQKIGKSFMTYNYNLEKVNLPEVKEIDDWFLVNNGHIKEIILPKVEKIGNYFMPYAKGITEINFPNLKFIGDDFLRHNEVINKVILPNVYRVGNAFLEKNKALKELSMKNLINVGYGFLEGNKILEKFDAQNLENVGDTFLHNNLSLKELSLPNLLKIGKSFLYHNEILEKIDVSKAIEIGKNFLFSNKMLEKLDIRNVLKIGDNFLCTNNKLKEFNAESVTEIGDSFLYSNNTLTEIIIPSIKKIGENFLNCNEKMMKIVGDIDIFPEKLLDTVKNNNTAYGKFYLLMENVASEAKDTVVEKISNIDKATSFSSGIKSRLSLAANMLKNKLKGK